MPTHAKTKGEAPPDLPVGCQSQTLGVAFFDLSRFSEWASSDDDARAASYLQSFYELAAHSVEAAGGRIVKFLGDAGLVVLRRRGVDLCPGLAVKEEKVVSQCRRKGAFPVFPGDLDISQPETAGPILAFPAK